MAGNVCLLVPFALLTSWIVGNGGALVEATERLWAVGMSDERVS